MVLRWSLLAVLAVSVQAGYLADLPNGPAWANTIINTYQFASTHLVTFSYAFVVCSVVETF
jgi:hypothetical protein